MQGFVLDGASLAGGELRLAGGFDGSTLAGADGATRTAPFGLLARPRCAAASRAPSTSARRRQRQPERRLSHDPRLAAQREPRLQRLWLHEPRVQRLYNGDHRRDLDLDAVHGGPALEHERLVGVSASQCGSLALAGSRPPTPAPVPHGRRDHVDTATRPARARSRRASRRRRRCDLRRHFTVHVRRLTDPHSPRNGSGSPGEPLLVPGGAGLARRAARFSRLSAGSQKTHTRNPGFCGDNAASGGAARAGGSASDRQEAATDRSDHAGDLLDGSGPPPGPVTIEVVSSRAAVVTLGGDHDVASRDAIADAFSVAGTGRDLLVDLTECTFIDSTIIKLLLQTMRALEEQDARLELVIDTDPRGHVARVAELMGIADVIPTHGSRSDGIRSLADGDGAPSSYV